MGTSEALLLLHNWTQPQRSHTHAHPHTHRLGTASDRRRSCLRVSLHVPASVKHKPTQLIHSSLAPRRPSLASNPRLHGTKHASAGQQHAAERAELRGGQRVGNTEVPHRTHFRGVRWNQQQQRQQQQSQREQRGEQQREHPSEQGQSGSGPREELWSFWERRTAFAESRAWIRHWECVHRRDTGWHRWGRGGVCLSKGGGNGGNTVGLGVGDGVVDHC